MKPLWWLTLLLALGFALAVGSFGSYAYSVVVGPRPTPSASIEPPKAVCPPRFLLDDGACIPVPLPDSPEEEFIPRLPSRPESFEEYLLPVEAPARLGTWRDFALPDDLAVAHNDPVALIAAPAEQLVRVVHVLDRPPALLAKGERWVLLGHRSEDDSVRIAVLYAPLNVEVVIEAGAALEDGAPIGKTLLGGVGIGFYKLRPGNDFSDGIKVLRPSESVPMDPRNHLLPKG